jgi:peptidoglycan/LPS O-acetylase OafA/YrhL
MPANTNSQAAAPAPLSQRKLVALDGVRGLAIAAVMLTHIAIQPVALNPVLRGTFALGWSGVDLFFVLSGFLITGILLDTRQCSNYFRSFYARRVLRIFPLYYGFLAFALLVFPYIVSPDFMPAPSHRWLYVCYVANWLPHAQWHVLSHFWSLCVEEQFYFIWPLVVLLVGPRRLLPLIVVLEVALVGGRSWWLWSHSHLATEYGATVFRVDGLLLGAGCAVLVRQFRLERRSVGALPWIALLFLATFVGGYHRLSHTDRHFFTQSIGFALLAISFAAFVLYAALAEETPGWHRSWLHWKPLVLFGKYSYGIYVFHYPIFYFANELFRRLPYAIYHSAWFAYVFVALESAASFAVAFLSYNFFEKRFLALKDRFAPVYRQPTAAAPPAAFEAALPLARS